MRCQGCGGTNTTYQLFSGGREYYCEDCDDTFPYEKGQAPRRIQMIADARTAELIQELRRERACILGSFCFRNGGDTACGECQPPESQACTCVPGYVVCDACRARNYPPKEGS